MTLIPINPAAIDHLLEALWERGGTDLHLAPGAPPLVRIDGRLVPIEDQPTLSAEEVTHLILGVLGAELTSRLRSEKELDFAFSWQERTRFRGNVYYQRGTIAMALRAIPYRIP